MGNNNNSVGLSLCNWCGQYAQIIWVHGHGQCSICGYNVDECCRGESCDSTENETSDTNKEEII